MLFLSARPSKRAVVGSCVSSCLGVPSGIHQSCNSCEEYILCNNGDLTRVGCPTGRSYDDTVKSCIFWSSTCDVQENNGTCVSTCLGVANGNYQSCRGCDVYVICSGNIRYDDIPCPMGLYWDDSLDSKSCVSVSTTCPPRSTDSGAERTTVGYWTERAPNSGLQTTDSPAFWTEGAPKSGLETTASPEFWTEDAPNSGLETTESSVFWTESAPNSGLETTESSIVWTESAPNSGL